MFCPPPTMTATERKGKLSRQFPLISAFAHAQSAAAANAASALIGTSLGWGGLQAVAIIAGSHRAQPGPCLAVWMKSGPRGLRFVGAQRPSPNGFRASTGKFRPPSALPDGSGRRLVVRSLGVAFPLRLPSSPTSIFPTSWRRQVLLPPPIENWSRWRGAIRRGGGSGQCRRSGFSHATMPTLANTRRQGKAG